jgi:hypothetical protein
VDIIVRQWKNTRSDKPQEDCYAYHDTKRVFVVTDGVTRTPDKGVYPNPSPASEASGIAAKAIYEHLIQHHPFENTVQDAFSHANRRIQELNEKLGFWKNTDYYYRDYAGAVAAALVLTEKLAFVGFMADCGVGHLPRQGSDPWFTPDQVQPVRRYFPPEPKDANPARLAEKQRLRQIKIRSRFRNCPRDRSQTYGVLTGEREAMAYVETFRRPYEPGDVWLVFSDGIRALVEGSADFRRLLSRGRIGAELDAFVKQLPSEQYPDDKTLMIIRT